ncbi:MAG: bifunctional diaminohydroxyphosphoribosylaminopyrimidine deaminase/5-amino-6-(5-phosphoribosylamino)uracil reductase RibD [Lentisphaerae bacterium]|nr:bifunctional diaminohydroxyphosphoribosylaminopyrimidine deaminase/5-amino-6-(5-phosphoribosylamino)uracil reductase RibD [Lentisphaerota bacterium]
MIEALALAGRGAGRTRPNPPVGCVVVREGRRVGQGFHRAAGAPHAEIVALRDAGEQARGADLYVTLEPCSTSGRTPPCTDALLAAGVRRVIVGTVDPNPAHAGRGLRQLRVGGVEVTRGVCRYEAETLIAPFGKWITTGRPWITLKMAISLDGAIADRRGRSQWITGVPARRWVDQLRSGVDAIMVGAGTACADNPGLMPRNRRRPTAHRVVVDSSGRLPLKAKLLTDAYAPLTVVATTAACSLERQADYEGSGAAVWALPRKGHHVSLRSLVRQMGLAGWLHVLCEGGGELGASLLREGLVDELVVLVAPLVIGGQRARPAIGGSGWLLAQAPRFEPVEQRLLGEDVLMRLRPRSQ